MDTKQQKLEKIINVMIRTIDGLYQTEIGSIVSDGEKNIGIIADKTKNSYKVYLNEEDKSYWYSITKDCPFEIVGRPIRFLDVLLTVEKKRPNALVVINDGKMTQINNDFAELLRQWDWNDDELRNQTEKAFNAILELFGGM